MSVPGVIDLLLPFEVSLAGKEIEVTDFLEEHKLLDGTVEMRKCFILWVDREPIATSYDRLALARYITSKS